MMIDKNALANRFAGMSEIFNDCDIKEDIKYMSSVIAGMDDAVFEDLINKESFSFDKLKGLFRKPGTNTPGPQSYQNYQKAGPSGKLLQMFDNKEVSNAYSDLPPHAKKTVDKYLLKWKMGDFVGKSASEDKTALFEDKSPTGTYNALNKMYKEMVKNFSDTYNPSLLPEEITNKLKELNTLFNSSKPDASYDDSVNDKKINKFLQVSDDYFNDILQKDITPELKAEYARMTGDVVGLLKGDIERSFRDSSPEATYEKKSPYAPAKAAPAQSAPAQSAPAQSAPAQSAPAQAAPAKAAPAQAAPAKAAPAQAAPSVAPVSAPRAKPAVKPSVKKAPAVEPAPAPAAKVKKVAPAVVNPSTEKKAPSAKKPSKLDIENINSLLQNKGKESVPVEPTKGKAKAKAIRVASDTDMMISEGICLSPTMVEVDHNSDEIKKLSAILACKCV